MLPRTGFLRKTFPQFLKKERKKFFDILHKENYYKMGLLSINGVRVQMILTFVLLDISLILFSNETVYSWHYRLSKTHSAANS